MDLELASIFMGRKVSPIAYRLGQLQDWRSQWFNLAHQPKYLEQDWHIRQYIRSQAQDAAIDRIEIKRFRNEITVVIYTARPGLLIGRQGAKIKELEEGLKKILKKIAKKSLIRGGESLPKLKLEIQEVKEFESHAQLLAQDIAEQLERRLPFRRVMKQALAKLDRYPAIKGAKIKVSGRLGGAEMARQEWLAKGEVPLGSLRSNIDYGFAEAVTKYGVIGVKVWINKGEVFDKKSTTQEQESLGGLTPTSLNK